MTLEEAIVYAEQQAIRYEKEAKRKHEYGGAFYDAEVQACLICAEQHKQLTKWLKELQERRKQSKWTLISEEYPQIGQRVLVTLVDGTMDIRRCKLAEYFDCYYGDVIAWMPAPEPQGRSGKENRWQMNKKMIV